MFFFCKDVKIQNHEYHYHCVRNPKQAKSKHLQKMRKKTMPRIDAMTFNTPQTKQSRSSGVSKQSTTLLQRLRKKTQSTVYGMQSAAGLKKLHKTNERQSNGSEQSMLYQLKATQSRGSLAMSDSIDDRKLGSFSFGIGKEVLQSQTFNEQIQQNPNYIIQEQSQLVQHSISDKFTQITKLTFNQQYQQILAIDSSINLVVLLKSFHSQNCDELLHRQLQIYNKIGSHPNILQLYQICFHNGKPIIVKQPYLPIIIKQDRDAIINDVRSLLGFLEMNGVWAGALKIGQFRQCYGVWKLADFSALMTGKRISIQDNISQLLYQIQ